jgi:hypothetical protein
LCQRQLARLLLFQRVQDTKQVALQQPSWDDVDGRPPARPQVDPGDVITLVISWHFNAAAMCEFSRQEFVKGMASLGCDSAEQLRRILPRLRAELEDPDRFKARCLPPAQFR